MSCHPKIKEIRRRCKKSSCNSNQNQCNMPTYRSVAGCNSSCNPCNTPKSDFCPPKGTIQYFTGKSDNCSSEGCEMKYLLPNTDEDKKYLTSYTNENGKQIFRWESVSGVTGGSVNADDVVGFCAKVTSCLTATPITSSQIADGSITTQKLANNSVTTEKLADGSVTNSKLANNSVTSDKIANGTITNEDISPSAGISGSKLDFSSSVPTGFCTAVANCGGGGGGSFTCSNVLSCINGFTDGSIPASKIGTIPSTQISGLCSSVNTCLTGLSGFGDGKVLSVSGSNLVWTTPSGGTPETPRQPEFFQNLTSGSTVNLASAPASGTILQVFRNGELWHPQGSAPDMTWSINPSGVITFSEPFGNSVNGSSAERVAVYFIKS